MSSEVTPSESCDSCGSQAFMKARRDGQILVFCGHHGREYRAALTAQGWQVVDECDQIYVRPSVPAHV